MSDAAFASVEEFRAQITLVQGADAQAIRERFVQRFVNPAHATFQARIGELRAFSDGPAYVGHLWDYFASSEAVSESALWERIGKLDAHVYAMWDVHSATLIRIPDFWKFPKRSIVAGGLRTIRRGLAFLPEDVYLFDARYTWCGALTHEWIAGGRYCLVARPG